MLYFKLSFCRNRGGGGSGTAVDAVGVSGKDFGCHPVLMSDGSLIRKGPAVAGAVFGGHPAFALVLFGGAPGPSAIVGLLQQNVAGAQFWNTLICDDGNRYFNGATVTREKRGRISRKIGTCPLNRRSMDDEACAERQRKNCCTDAAHRFFHSWLFLP